MKQVKGAFIGLTVSLMTLYKEQQKEADKVIFDRTGKYAHELEPEQWYDVSVLDECLKRYASASVTGKRAIVTMGKRVFPTLRRMGKVPSDLKTVFEALTYIADDFVNTIRGAGTVKVLKATEGHFILQVPDSAFSCLVHEGVCLGVLESFRAEKGSVKQTKCVAQGDRFCELHITW